MHFGGRLPVAGRPLGGHITGGQILGDWPGLGHGSLFRPGDLGATTDYRDVLAELVRVRLNNTAVDQVFPGQQPIRQGFIY